MHHSAPPAGSRSLEKIDFRVDSGVSACPPKGAVTFITRRMFYNTPPPRESQSLSGSLRGFQMRYFGLCAILGLVWLACTPTLDSTAPSDVVTARFDPAVTPPDVPTPTDLAKDSTTGLLAIPVSPSAAAAEREFIEKFLNTLNGYPPDTPATANFDARFHPRRVNRTRV